MVSPLFGGVETGFSGLILFFLWGCGKSGGRGGVRQRARLGPGWVLDSLAGLRGRRRVSEGGIEGRFQALGGGKLDGLDHKWFLRLRTFSHRIFDCAPGEGNYVQTGHADLFRIRFRTLARFSEVMKYDASCGFSTRRWRLAFVPCFATHRQQSMMQRS